MINVDLEVCELLPEREELAGWKPKPNVNQGNWNGTYQGGSGNLNINQTNQTNINGNFNVVVNVNAVSLYY